MVDQARNRQLDGLRGYAAIAVIVFHSILDRDPTLNERSVRPPLLDAHGIYDVLTKLVLMLVSGETAVVLFFVLSGTVLFESLRRRAAPPFATAAGFSIRRLCRLYPTFFFFLICGLGAFALSGNYATQAPHFWPNAALRDFSILGASWTLQVELLAVPFVLVAYWAYRRWGPIGIGITYVAFAVLLYEPAFRDNLVYFRRFLSCFALGMLIPTDWGRRLAKRSPHALWPIVLIAMLATRHLFSLHWWTMNIVQLWAALLVMILYYRRAGSLGEFLERNVSQYLGRLSYSMYLGNIMYLVLVAHLTRDIAVVHAYPLAFGVLLSVPIVLISIATAHLTEKNLERRSIALGHRLSQFRLGYGST